MPPKPRPKTILLADDDAVTVATISAALKAAGFDVIIARDAMQTVMATHRSRPDAIILDIQMPGGTGVEALGKIKASKFTKGIPVIIITGSEDPDLPERMKALGAVDYFKKPVQPGDVQRRIKALFAPSPDAAG